MEDLDFLEKWLKVGNKWREIANLIDGRTESQVKNRFKLILRRELIQQKNHDPDELKNKVIPQIISQLQKRISLGDGDMVNKKDGNEMEDEYSDPEGEESSNQNSKVRLKEQEPCYKEISQQIIGDLMDSGQNNQRDYEGDSIMQ